MNKFLALTRKEAAAILLSPSILFATAFFVLLDSFAFYLKLVDSDAAHTVFDDIALFMLFTSIVLFPVISMHSFAAEKVSGTLETLLTAPISDIAAVMAKYAGAMLYVLVHLVHGLVYAVLLSRGGNLDWNSTLAAFLALLAVGSLTMSLGIFISSVTASPAAAGAGTGGFLIFLVVVADIDTYSGSIAGILHYLSFIPHAKRWISGELDTRGLVYFLSVTALFLFYAWLSIGLRGTEQRPASPVVRRRLTAIYFLAAAGVVLLIVQAAVLHINGLWESGMPLLGTNLSQVPGHLFVPVILSALSFVCFVIILIAANRAARRSVVSESRAMRAPGRHDEDSLRGRHRMAVAAAAALAIVLNLNWLAHYPFRTFLDSGALRFLSALQGRSLDVSEDGRNSLSAATRRVLDSLQGRVQIYCFLPEALDVRDVPVAEETRRLLGRYGDYNSLVSSTFADAVREPALATSLAEEINVPAEGLEQLLVIDYQGRRLAVSAASLVAPPDWRAQMAGEERWVFDGENRLTRTLMRLADPRIPNIFFTYGHLEHSPGSGTHPERSVSRLARALAGANMRVRQLTISRDRPIPPECDILAVVSPRVAFQEHEAEEIRRYLDGGGRLIVFAPAAGREVKADADPLNRLLFDIGGGYRDDLIMDRQNNDNGLVLAPLGKLKGGENALSLVFPSSRSFRDNPRSVENGWTSERMVVSHDTAVAEDADDGSMRPGPFTLLYRAAMTAGGREARVVAVAAGRMAADSDIAKGANEALILGMVQWLAGREEADDIAPRAWIDRRFVMTGPGKRAVLWIGVMALPLAWLLAGISVWWLRKD